MSVQQFKNYLSGDVDYRTFLAKQQQQFVRPAESFREEVDDLLVNGVQQTGDTMPWGKTHDKLRFRRGEITIWSGAKGSYKSMVTGMIATHFMRSRKVLIASLEMKPATTLMRMCMQACGRMGPIPFRRDAFFRAANDRLWLYDQSGKVSTDSALGLVTYAAENLGCDHIFWDSLMMAGLRHEDYDGQHEFTATLADIAKASNCHIHLVSHLRKTGGPEHMPSMQDVKGASEIVNVAHNVVLVWANRPKAHAKSKGEHVDELDPDLRLIVDAQRNGEFEGHIGLYFNRSTLQFTEQPTAESVMDMV
jgi:twinkle protein